MPKILLIDGVKFREWTPNDEEKEFHPLVKQNFKQIFGEDSIYFDIKPRLYSKSGIGGIPDAYVITLSKPYRWYIVENELSSHDVYEHIVGQVTKFMSLIDELENQRDLIKTFCNEIDNDLELQATVKKRVGTEIYRFISELVAQPPKIALIIDGITSKFEKALLALNKLADTEVVEFRTFAREDAENVRAHLFQPISKESKKINNGNYPSQPSKYSVERGQQYLQFYQELATRLKEKVPKAVAKPNTKYYCYIPTGLGGVHFEWTFWGNPRSKFGVELHFETSQKELNLKRIKECEKQKAEIEKATGEQVYFLEDWGTKWSRLYLEKKEGAMTEDLKKWAVDKMALLYELLLPKIEHLKTQ
jgi:hypothetical protein